MINSTVPLDVAAFEARNSRAYLSAVFQAWRDGLVVANIPKIVGAHPSLNPITTHVFDDDTGWFDETLDLGPSEVLSQVAFSSGTTGTPKAIALTHGGQWDVVNRINGAMEVDATIREYVGVPVTFSFGFGRVRAVAAIGGKSFLPTNGFDPTEIAAMLRDGQINAVSAVPTLWRLVLANQDIFGPEVKSLRWIEIGSQYMSGVEKAQLRSLFPNANIVQHYGLTEASRSSLLNISEVPETRLESVGRATGNVELSVDTSGRIRVRGPHLAAGILTENDIEPVVDEDGWLTTSDMGRLEDGWLYYEGRCDELINSGGIKIDPARFEQRLARALASPDAVAVGKISNTLRGEQVLIATQSDSLLDAETVQKAALKVAEEFGLHGKGALCFRTVQQIPRTTTGKVQRHQLADVPSLSGSAKSETTSADLASTPQAAEMQKIWAEALNTDHVPLDKGFYDLGGDSLSALTTIIRMEAIGLDPEVARSIFDGRTIAQLTNMDVSVSSDTEATSPKSQGHNGLSLGELVNSLHAVRGILILWVVVIHWLPGIMARLGDENLEIYNSLSSLWRFGTPGFALVFGFGIGALRLQQYADNRSSALRNVLLSTWLVGAGVASMALLQTAVLWSDGALFDYFAPSRIFYSVVTFYFLSLLLMPLLLRWLSFGRDRLASIGLGAAAAFLIHQVLHANFAHLSPSSGWMELLKILFTAKYGFFQMTGYVLVGACAGWVVRQHHGQPFFRDSLLKYAGICVALGIVLFYFSPSKGFSELRAQLDLRYLIIYLGVLLALLYTLMPLNRLAQSSKVFGVTHMNTFLVATGILALPIFVGHALVIPLKTLMANLGVPGAVALLIALVVFLGAMFMVYRRVLRIVAK